MNQIRAWVHEGRTDAWIAHQLDIPTSELREFRRRHGLNPEDSAASQDDLRDEIEAEVEAATLAAAEEEERRAEEEARRAEEADEDEDDEDEGEDDDEGGPRRRRRRRRRGGRGRRRAIEASFDHGEQDGYGLWLDPSVRDNPVYAEHWAGHSAVKVTIEADQIVIRRAD